jgi:hypothetical protein
MPLLTLLILALSCDVSFCASNEAPDITGIVEINAWCNKAFGGSSITEIGGSNFRIIHVSRRHTSGRLSSEDAIYMVVGNMYVLLRKYNVIVNRVRKCYIVYSTIHVIETDEVGESPKLVDRIPMGGHTK